MNYYAVERTGDHLEHYGVKGMRWGVRKAIERGNTRALSRHYNRAARKLERLTARTDKEYVSAVKKSQAKKAPGQALLGGLASGLGTFAINSHLPMAERLKYAGAIGGGMALANGIASGIENAEYRRMLSKKGYAKNTAKRKEFEKGMRDAFKGTEYAKQINKTKSNIHGKLNTAKKLLSNPAGGSKVKNANRKSSSWDDPDIQKALSNWANTFEKQYQKGLSKGMTHEQAERYSNDYIAKNGFGAVNKSKKRR